jgi:hypothetical protein
LELQIWYYIKYGNYFLRINEISPFDFYAKIGPSAQVMPAKCKLYWIREELDLMSKIVF